MTEWNEQKRITDSRRLSQGKSRINRLKHTHTVATNGNYGKKETAHIKE